MTAPTTAAARNAAILAAPAVPHPLRSVGAFIALCMILAGGGALATSTMSAAVPFLLALAPAAIALGITSFEGKGSTGGLVRLLWKRPVRRHWYVLIALPVGWALATVAVGVAVGRSSGDLFRDVFPSVLIVPLVVFLPALAEELAWRGFAVPRMMTAFSPLRTGLILSAPWVVMHLVLMLPGGINQGLALWSAVVSLVAYSVVLTWIFVRSGGSVLLAALVHAGFNGVVPLMRGIEAEASWDIRAVLAAVIAFAIVALGGFRASPAPAQPAGLSVTSSAEARGSL